jgi:hypothetical protein
MAVAQTAVSLDRLGQSLWQAELLTSKRKFRNRSARANCNQLQFP